MHLMAFKLVYGLIHLTTFNNFSAQASNKPYLLMIKENIFLCVASPFLAQWTGMYRCPNFHLQATIQTKYLELYRKEISYGSHGNQ